MRLVLEYGEEHSDCVAVVPPSPNSSSGSVSNQEAIRQAHRIFQTDRPVRPGSPVQVAPVVAPGPAPEAVSVEASVAASSVGEADSIETDSRSISAGFPADNPAPRTLAGGFTSFDVFIEFGDVEFDQSVADWYKFSRAPTEYKLVAGANGREFLFCLPDFDDVMVNPVDATGRRTVGSQVKPKTQPNFAQTDLVPPLSPADDATVPAEAVVDGVEVVPEEPGNVDESATSGSVTSVDDAEVIPDELDVDESTASGNETTVSSTTAAAQREDFLASVELTK